MGLLIDNNGIPVTYWLLRGNTSDCDTYLPILDKIKTNTVFHETVRGASQEMKEFVLYEKDYEHIGEEGFKMKSRIVPTKIYVINNLNKRFQVEIDQKQIVFSALTTTEKRSINETKSCRKVRDFCPRTNIPDGKVMHAYRGLWKIEKSFKITKSELQSRPAFVRLKDYLDAHFLTCITNLLVLRAFRKRYGESRCRQRDLLSANYDPINEKLSRNLPGSKLLHV